MDDAHLRVASINGDALRRRVGGGRRPRERLNSIAVDEHGAIYTVTDTAQYKHRAARRPDRGGLAGQVRDRGGLRRAAGRRLRLDADGHGDGPGRRPLRGHHRRPAAHAPRAHVARRDTRGLAADRAGQGPPHRMRGPVRFGDPNATESLDEQSVLVRGYASILVNNQLRNSTFLDPLPASCAPSRRRSPAAIHPRPARAGAHRLGPADAHVLHGVGEPGGLRAQRHPEHERGHEARVRDRPAHRDVGTRGAGFRDRRSRCGCPTTPLPSENSFYAATEIGPDGAIWTGTFGGITTYRPPPAPSRRRPARTSLRRRSRSHNRGRGCAGCPRAARGDAACTSPVAAPQVEVAVKRRGGQVGASLAAGSSARGLAAHTAPAARARRPGRGARNRRGGEQDAGAPDGQAACVAKKSSMKATWSLPAERPVRTPEVTAGRDLEADLLRVGQQLGDVPSAVDGRKHVGRPRDVQDGHASRRPARRRASGP